MDYAGADDLGNPIGGIIFTTAIPGTNGKATQLQYWTNFSECRNRWRATKLFRADCSMHSVGQAVLPSRLLG